ncbi:uncharacterized protein HMPREF1541_08906 [Cyphellophora europaea CBS 101466]|uniref:Xylanolytic transcriptional activator regulatory domain-containing protein n=1 Tax=Cyphellophora europaea (strain CBS 101466) TaxID=1220924 RepID=W2RLN9_CYPE1|nr:uncharacterized protein HMPREF1541_08906 [Cyphellophora europaea CBS 101466]ETN36628.1 hypothetical protein HMPREF1541_08906 [Cyphellophora europaea CBS 101466]
MVTRQRVLMSTSSDAGLDEMSARVKYLEGILKHKSFNVPLDIDSLRRKYNELRSPRRSVSNARSETAEDEDDLNIEDESIEIRPVDHNVTHYSGEFSYWNFSMKIKKHVEEWINNPQDRKGSKDLPEYWRPQELSTGSSNIGTALQSLPPVDIANFLIKVFFKYAQRNYFYVYKRWLLKQVHLAYHEAWRLKDPGSVAIIFAVLAVGTQYAHMDAGHADKDAIPSEDEVGAMFYQTATRLLPEIIQTSSLESVQAVTLLGLYALPLDASGLSYVYYSLAIRLAIQNGMHRKYQGTELSAVAVETRNRVWWTACSVEKKIGIFHGRPMSVLRSDVDADYPKDIQQMPDDDGPLSIERMVISIKLINYLEDFMLEIQQLRKRDRKELTGIILRLTEMKAELTNWWDSIPETAFNVDPSTDGQAYRSCIHLQLLYCLTRMFIGRPFLFTGGRLSEESPRSPPDTRKSQSQSDHTSKQREGSTTSTTDGKKRPSRRLALVENTVNAAVEALELCRGLYDGNEGLARASYIEYSSCRASMLALIAYSIQEQTDQYRVIMQKGLEMSREMSAAGESARAESTLIEALERAVARLQMFGPGWQRREVRRESAAHIQQTPQVSNYDRFRNWQQTRKKGSGPQSGNQTPSMPPPTSAWDQQQPQLHNNPNAVPMESMYDQSSPFTGSDATGYMIPNAPSISDGDSTGFGLNSAAEAAFFQTLNGMGDVTPSASGVNGWLTQARPERQVLDHFLAMPEGDVDTVGMGYAGAGQQGFGGGTSWYDLPGAGHGSHLPGFGGW